MSATVRWESFNRRLGRWTVRLSDGRTLYRYRWLMEQHVGRTLRPDEHVHHVNGDSTDDRLENLELLSARAHSRLHIADRLAGQRAAMAYEWSTSHPACVECGTTERPHTARGMCGRCYFTLRARVKHGHSPRKPAEVVTRPCEFCGVEFSRTRSRGGGRLRFCSRSCRSKAIARDRWDQARKAAA